MGGREIEMFNYMVFGMNMFKFHPIFKIFRAHNFFSLMMKAELMHLTCLVYGDYEALRYILYALTRVLMILKTP